MQNLMLKLDHWLRRRRGVVIGAWLVLVLAAVPFAAKQSEHLSGGGYTIPGSASQQVLKQLPALAPGAQKARLADVLAPTDHATAAEMSAALAQLTSATRGIAHVSVSPNVRIQTQRAIAAAGANQRTLVVPLDMTVNEEGATNVATKLRSGST